MGLAMDFHLKSVGEVGVWLKDLGFSGKIVCYFDSS